MKVVTIMLLLVATRVAGQQVVDPDFKAAVKKPAYTAHGPRVAIDEAHGNFHTAGGQYAPFAALLRADGYDVVASTAAFTRESLAGAGVLVIANARNMKALVAGDRSQPAFTEDECDTVASWVRAGGSLLLIADHAPYGAATRNLAARFHVDMGDSWVFERSPSGGITTQLVFSRDNQRLGVHPILNGRTAAEAIKTVRLFTGQSLSIPPGATVLFKLPDAAREAATPDDLDAEDAAIRSADGSHGVPGTHSRSVAGRAQGIAMSVGGGRVVVLGEAALLSAQIVRTTVDGRQREAKMGMNMPGYDDQQFALNTLHWLSRLLN